MVLVTPVTKQWLPVTRRGLQQILKEPGQSKQKKNKLLWFVWAAQTAPGPVKRGNHLLGLRSTRLHCNSSFQVCNSNHWSSFVVSHLGKLNSYTAIPSFNHLIHVLIQAIDNFNVFTLIQFMYLLCFCWFNKSFGNWNKTLCLVHSAWFGAVKITTFGCKKLL